MELEDITLRHSDDNRGVTGSVMFGTYYSLKKGMRKLIAFGKSFLVLSIIVKF